MASIAYSSNVPEATRKIRRTRAPQARGEARRKQLLAAAIELLEQNELANITLSDVAGRSGVPLGSIYYHYKSINRDRL